MLEDELRNRFLPGEHIVWSGQPRQGLAFSARDIFLVPFTLLWCGFTVFCEASVLRVQVRPDIHARAPAVFALFGSFFVLPGLYFVSGRFIVDAWARRRTTYAVTNRRMLILRGGPFNNFVAIGLERLSEIGLSERASGRGVESPLTPSPLPRRVWPSRL